MLGAYYDEVVVGLELVDSDILSALDDLRRWNRGCPNHKHSSVCQGLCCRKFLHRWHQRTATIGLYNRGYVKYGQKVDVNGKYEPAQAYYDMTIETSVYTIGIGFPKFSKNMFTSFDFYFGRSLRTVILG